MSELAAQPVVSLERPTLPALNVRLAWRNLWRNRRRTWLTVGGIAFAILLVVFSMSMQLGQYEIIMDNATSMLNGHVQVRSQSYLDNQRFEDTLGDATALRRLLESYPGVAAVAPRVEAFALASAGERSFGAQVVGVDFEAESRTVRFLDFVSEGRVPRAADEALVGTVLARNLGVQVGDEVVLLGAGKQGGVAALAVQVVGLFLTNQVELDRSMLWTSLPVVQDGFGLADEVHTLAIRTINLDDSPAIQRGIAARLASSGRDDAVARNWDRVMPEVRQAIEIDRLGGELFFYIIEVLVVFSVVNTFIMTVFERTREFGMLLAIGMRPWSIVGLVQWEAAFIWLIGSAVGVGVASVIVLWLSSEGVYMGEALEEYAAQVYMPTRLYPSFAREAFTQAPLVMFIGTQLAALVSSVRILRLRPVEALRTT